jgi:hypothetical protein
MLVEKNSFSLKNDMIIDKTVNQGTGFNNLKNAVDYI